MGSALLGFLRWLICVFAVVVFVSLLLFGCASTEPYIELEPEREQVCKLDRVEWEVTRYVEAACSAAGARDLTLDGCYYQKRDGTHRIITRAALSERDLMQIAGHELMHACFGAFHPRTTTDTLSRPSRMFTSR